MIRVMHHKTGLILFLLSLLWLAVIVFACFLGSVPLKAQDIALAIWHYLSGDSAGTLTQKIVLDLRLARILLASLAGAALALSGVCLQGVLQNDLAEPFTLGISQGAACGQASCSQALSRSFSVPCPWVKLSLWPFPPLPGHFWPLLAPCCLAPAQAVWTAAPSFWQALP